MQYATVLSGTHAGAKSLAASRGLDGGAVSVPQSMHGWGVRHVLRQLESLAAANGGGSRTVARLLGDGLVGVVR